MFDDIETRDAAKYADHVDDFLARAQSEDKAFHLIVGMSYPSSDWDKAGVGVDIQPHTIRTGI